VFLYFIFNYFIFKSLQVNAFYLKKKSQINIFLPSLKTVLWNEIFCAYSNKSLNVEKNTYIWLVVYGVLKRDLEN